MESIKIPAGSDVAKFVDGYIESNFGGSIDDYFVHASQRVSSKVSRKEFQIVLVEDKKGKMVQLRFEIEK